MKKTIFSFLISFFIIFTNMSYVIFAGGTDAYLFDSGNCGKNMYWFYNYDACRFELDGNGKMKDYTSNDTREYEKYISQIKKIIFSNGVISIGNYAFSDCSSLKNVDLTNEITSIGDYAFSNCTSLKEIIIPESVKNIGENAFYGINNLTVYCKQNSVADNNLLYPNGTVISYVDGFEIGSKGINGVIEAAVLYVNEKYSEYNYYTSTSEANIVENNDRAYLVICPLENAAFASAVVVQIDTYKILYETGVQDFWEGMLDMFLEEANISFENQNISSEPLLGLPDDGISIVINGNEFTFDINPCIIDGTTMVPMRGIFEALGAEVTWEGSTKTITAVKGSTKIEMAVGNKILNKNGVEITLTVPPQMINGVTLVSARAVAEAFGANVDWNSTDRTVCIDTYAKTNALLINADNNYTQYDSPLFRDALLKNTLAISKEENIYVITEPKKEEFESLINQLVKQAGEDDTTYFFYSGHGGCSGMNKELHPGEDCYISPYFSHTSNNDNIFADGQYSISMKDLIENYLDRIPGTIVVILHSCHSGEINQREFGIDKNKFKIITSCREDETTELEKAGIITKGQFTTGRFMKAFLMGLGEYESDNLIEKYILGYNGKVNADYDNDRNVTLKELYKYIDENMDKTYVDDDGNKCEQNPTVSSINDETVIYSY